MAVTALGYVGIASSDVPEWREFFTLLGGAIDDQIDDGFAVTVDDWSRRFLVTHAERDDVDFVGWQVDGPTAIEHVGSLMGPSPLVELTPEELELRQIEGGMWTLDPLGVRIELFYGPQRCVPSSVSMTRFVTGPLGLGHVVFATSDLAAAVRFYIEVLGFRHTDTCLLDGTEIVFLRCNDRHHSLAIAQMASERHMLHAMVEVESIDAVGRAFDRFASAGRAKTVIGRHSNDHMLSFYARTPSGFSFEYGAAGRLIDEHLHVPSVYHAESAWGHQPFPEGCVG